MPHGLVVNVYAPPLAGDGARALAAIQGFERALPGLRLSWEITDEGRPVALPRRDEWLAAAAIDGEVPLLCNGDEAYPITIWGLESSAMSSPGRRPRLDVHAGFPLDQQGIAAAADVLEGIGDGIHAFWGVASPFRATVEIAEQVIHPSILSHPQEPPPRGLPGLKLPKELSAPEIPDCLGWLNYWSAAAATAIGFPDPARDADLLARARRTPTGAWLVRLTETPLDLDNSAHLDALLCAYDRVPAIGGRADV
jgi:hypothetical protein